MNNRRWKIDVYSGLKPYYAKVEADKVLDEFVAITKKLNVNYCLILATCLGFVREHDYLEHDNDIDVLVLPPKAFGNVTVELKKAGFRAGRKWVKGVPNSPYGFQHWWKREILLDLHWIHYAECYEDIDWIHLPKGPLRDRKRSTWGISKEKERANLRLYAKFLKSFDKVNCRGQSYNVPHPVHKYLQVRYGKNWRTPEIW